MPTPAPAPMSVRMQVPVSRPRVRLEICIDRLESAIAARDGGADRIEICGALACGGVSPGPGLVTACLELAPLEVMVMVRPHAGSFVYSAFDLAVMEREIEWARRVGAHGVVFGALTPDRCVDRAACRRLLDVAGPIATTFHRAFDLTRDPREALEVLSELGVARVLSSGQATTASEGASLLRGLVEQSAGRIAVMPGAGITAGNVARLLTETGAGELHASASEPIEPIEPIEPVEPVEPSATSHCERWDFVSPSRWTTAARVRSLRAAIDAVTALP